MYQISHFAVKENYEKENTVTANDTTPATSLLFPCSAPFERSLENYRNLKLEDQKQQMPIENYQNLTSCIYIKLTAFVSREKYIIVKVS